MNELVDFVDRVRHAVKAEDVVSSRLRSAALVDLLRKEFPSLKKPARGTVRPGFAVKEQILNLLDNPRLDRFAHRNRVADVFPCNFKTKLLELVGVLNNLTNFVFEVFRAFVQNR